jgi:carbonic anhydrase
MTTREINISADNVVGECELKCMYNHKYLNSSCVATNNGVMILLSYDKTSTPPVTYNNNKYDVGQITIYSPSFHKYNGDFMDAEIIITHNPIMGGAQLAVAIPIIQSTMTTTATSLLTQIILGVSNGAPKNGESTTISLSNFSLTSIIPSKPFYNFSDTTNNIECIAFDKENSIDLSQQTLNTLRSIIGKYDITAYGSDLFYNKKGPNTASSTEGDIYISCSPTGNSEEIIDVVYDKPSVSVDVLSNPIFKFLVGALIFIISFYVIHVLILFFAGKYEKNSKPV